MDNDTIYTLDLNDNLSPKLFTADEAAKQLQQTLLLINSTANALGYSFSRAFDTQKITDFVNAATNAYGYITQASGQMSASVQGQMAQAGKETKDGFMSSWKEVMEFGNTAFDFSDHVNDIFKHFKKGGAAEETTNALKDVTKATGLLTGAAAAGGEAAAGMAGEELLLNAALDAIPGGLVVSALVGIATWMFNTKEETHKLKEEVQDVNTLSNDMQDIDIKAASIQAGRLSKMMAEMDMVKHLKSESENTANTEKQKNEYLNQALGYWRDIKKEGGEFTKNLSDTKIDIEDATMDMKDFGEAVKYASMRAAGLSEMQDNDKKAIEEKGKVDANAAQASEILTTNKQWDFDKHKADLRKLFSEEDIDHYLVGHDLEMVRPNGTAMKVPDRFYDGDKLQQQLALLTNDLKDRIDNKYGKLNEGVSKIVTDYTSKEDAETKAEKKTVNSKDSFTNIVSPSFNTYTPGTDTTASPAKNISIKIDIKELVHEFKIQTTNLQESLVKVKDLVAQALISAVNDSEIGEY